MKRQNLTLLLTVFLSMVGANTFAHDIEVENNDGVTIYYNYSNDGTELAVTFRGTSVFDYSDEYTGNVVIPEEVTYMNTTRKVTSIYQCAFYDCDGLTSVTIPNSVTSIGKSAFYACNHLPSINIPSGVTSLSDNVFEGCNLLTSIIIPNGVTSIGYQAFLGCWRITSITIPNSLTSIGIEAFKNCSSLTSVTIYSSLPSYGGYSFPGNRTEVTLYVPAGRKSAYESASGWSDFKEIVEMPSEVGITIGEASIGTYCSEYSLDFTGSDAKAYVVSSFDSGSGQVTMNRVYKTTPNTGLVIKGSTGNYDISLGDGGSTASNMLVGVTENTVLNKVVGDYTNYILAKKGGEAGFYAVSDGSTLKANKAYLPLKTDDLPASARIAFFFDDEETTDIKAVEEQQIFNVQDDVIIYNLNGQRMTGLQKGLNIINGKKVIIK